MPDVFIQFAQKALIIKDNKLLMIKKSSKDPINSNKWEVPGGRKQTGESLDEHIIREVKEETSLIVNPKEIFDMYQFCVPINNENVTVVCVARFCDLLDGKIKITEDEIDDIIWANIDSDLLNYDLIPDIRNTIEKLVNKYKKHCN